MLRARAGAFTATTESFTLPYVTGNMELVSGRTQNTAKCKEKRVPKFAVKNTDVGSRENAREREMEWEQRRDLEGEDQIGDL